MRIESYGPRGPGKSSSNKVKHTAETPPVDHYDLAATSANTAVEKFQQAAREFKRASQRLLEDSQVDVQRKDYRVEPGSRLKLSQCDPKVCPGLPQDADVVKALTEAELKQIYQLQEKLYAQHQHKLLIVFQAMDTAGKDGSIKTLSKGFNAQGVEVTSFKQPTSEELAHDPLWRVHPHLPGDGKVAIFNRSHYEDILVTRVHGLISDKQAEERTEHIRDFEKMAADNGTTIIKFFLHIDKDEQKRRLEARRDDPDKRWKFSPADIEERKHWEHYQEVYQDAISATSTKEAPWYVIPANNKPQRDLVVASIVRKHLEKLDLHFPKADPDLGKVVIE